MQQPLAGKRILLIDDEPVFRTLLSSYFTSLGAITQEANDGVQGLSQIELFNPDLLICDLAMPEMNGIELVKQVRLQGATLPILVISATESMAEIAQVLRLGVQDVLLKPVTDLNQLRETALNCLYPTVFNSAISEKANLMQDWDALNQDPYAAYSLLKDLQPPVQQQLIGCQINYRQLTSAQQPELALDIAALSDKDLAFYCLDVTRAGENGVLAALLLRALFNNLIRDHMANQQHRLPEMSLLLKQINHLLRQGNLEGQFPLLLGYYHVGYQKLILVSAGLHATLTIDGNQIALNNGMPLGTLRTTYLTQISQDCQNWQCQVWGNSGQLRLALRQNQPE